MLDFIGDLLILSAAIPGLLFPLLYTLLGRPRGRDPWWGSAEGRFLFSTVTALGILATVALIDHSTETDWIGLKVINLIVYVTISYQLWKLVFLLLNHNMRDIDGSDEGSTETRESH